MKPWLCLHRREAISSVGNAPRLLLRRAPSAKSQNLQGPRAQPRPEALQPRLVIARRRFRARCATLGLRNLAPADCVRPNPESHIPAPIRLWNTVPEHDPNPTPAPRSRGPRQSHTPPLVCRIGMYESFVG